MACAYIIPQIWLAEECRIHGQDDFCSGHTNAGFRTLKKFNRRPSRPIIRMSPKCFLLETIVQALIYVCLTMKTSNLSTVTELAGISSPNLKEPTDGINTAAEVGRSRIPPLVWRKWVIVSKSNLWKLQACPDAAVPAGFKALWFLTIWILIVHQLALGSRRPYLAIIILTNSS